MHVNHDELVSLIDYSPETGLFRWKHTRGPMEKNSTAGTPTPNGYLRITINKKGYLAHRLAWFYVFKEWPRECIDHKNRIRSDNRISNLREATTSQNHHNTGLYRNNSSGYKGVYYSKREKKFLAQIMTNGKRESLGYYETAELAHAAYKAASIKSHKEFSSLN